MIRIREIAGVTAVILALSAGAALAHGAAGEEAEEFQEHMDVYAAEINDLIAAVDAIAADYAPGRKYTEQSKALVAQWESVAFHEAVETNAMPLYPPVWAAIGAFSTALEAGAPAATVRARADEIAAALWQGYGGLKLLAAGEAQGHAGGHRHDQAQAKVSGVAVIDTINKNLDQVLVLYKKGQNKVAKDLIHDTYMQHFEGIEGDLIEQNAELVSSLEADFNASLPQLIANGAAPEKVAAQIDAMQADLDEARGLLAAAAAQESPVF